MELVYVWTSLLSSSNLTVYRHQSFDLNTWRWTIKFQFQKRLGMFQKYENKISSYFHSYTLSFNLRRWNGWGPYLHSNNNMRIFFRKTLNPLCSSALFATNANHTRNHLSFEAALWASSSSVIWRTFSYAVTYHTVYIHTYSNDISSYVVCMLFYTHMVVRKPSISQISKLQYSRVEPLLD